MRSGTLFPLFAFKKKQKKTYIESKEITKRKIKYEKNSQKSSDDNSWGCGGVFACVDNSNCS